MSNALVTSDLIKLYDRVFTDGGFTVEYGADGSLTPVTSGYVVSATDEQRTVPVDTPFDLFADAVERLHKARPDVPALGGWVDGSRLYLDPVEVVNDRSRAEFLGRLRRQIAIFDLDSAEEIRL